MVVKKATRQRKAKRKNRKQREWDSRYIADSYIVKKPGATIKLALKQKTLELYGKT